MKIKNMLHMNELNLKNKKVLIRVDFNVPIVNNKIMSDMRIQASIPTIQLALKNHAKVIVMSHLGRPKEGKYQKQFSLLPIFQYLKKIFNKTKIYFSNNLNKIQINSGELLILENVRFNIGEKNNDISLSQKYASLCDIFVMDAFGSAHRKESSTFGIGMFTKIACAGPLLISEIKKLSIVLKNPERPMISIVGGSKISTKFKLIQSLAKLSDTVIVGGGIANTFLAIDYNIGKSLYEPKFIDMAKKIKHQYNIIIPIDSRVGTNFSTKSSAIVKKPFEIHNNEEIMDLGDKSIENMTKIIKKAKTILWNGPVGVFEFPKFSIGTKKLATSIANSKAFSIAGGGETISVINMFNIQNKISYISTGGGAFLEFIEKNTLSSIHMLEISKKKYNLKNNKII
ncbi:phosphoglycerate kinase [Buchnera aphidicola]|uniref:Phosphoglycerate kinase n=1 Tax=Buchnera aphidicola (Stegophylla sp.) TaxID=2315800 RepID=A0A4D6YLC1_9GAMM|nr:phosphoglycerate kinase [Buchnera aphidicola (Stegophylla sp.)]QCI26438.1 phosphoglycerate kinase [Buchnera aphidicola (Stegophylla sp.)]